ncbi:C45 family autoproteolytic acyltransferase/hydolase [Dyadobacter jejuensis]|uniref:C45 family autoproteolytic acyltransferase/hydolase n=1 Tax=Dyadobacter jejuensis TaxID=1082580 RepID=UPI001E651857|nr:C45 family peptidase [Dyadobacter jejuensis]
MPTPTIDASKRLQDYKRERIGPDHYAIGPNWLKKNEYGVWEMYLEGAPYERGLIYGILAKELMEKQEVAFVDQINELIPNSGFLQVLKGFVAWFNKDIYKYVPQENLDEIYGVSQSFSDRFDYIGPKYYRILNYHAAHDIGHALTDLNMVGCTSFSVNNALSADSSLLVGRNFDFYMGDAFAEDKLLVFVKPDKGYGFASYAWAGLTGVVSGMNEKGLAVTLNASKSDIPYGAKDPISLLAREILQYAANIEEAVAIAQKRETFVSESLLVASAQDNKTVIIEKSPSKMGVYDTSDDLLVCANHYQSETFRRDSANIQNIRSSDSNYRFKRMQELLDGSVPIDVEKATHILRDKNGLNDEFIGYGNPKALNQLIAHHSIVFKPTQHTFWVSSSPYQLGAYLAYDLKKVFSKAEGELLDNSLTVPSDPFLNQEAFKQYEENKATRHKINRLANMGVAFELSPEEQRQFIDQNPNSFLTYLALGDYFYAKKQFSEAEKFYSHALNYETSSANETATIREKILACKEKL